MEPQSIWYDFGRTFGLLLVCGIVGLGLFAALKSFGLLPPERIQEVRSCSCK